MSDAADALRGVLAERRERLALFQRDETASAAMIDQLETQLAAERRRRNLLVKHAQHEADGIAAIEAALTVLTERLPVDDVPDVPAPTTQPAADVPSIPAPPVDKRKPLAMRVMADAEVIDLGSLSQRTVARAEGVRAVLAAAQGEPVSFEAIVQAMLANEPSEAKARTATEVGLTILIADGRGRIHSAANDTFKLTPPEYASANLGARLGDFKGRTTTWPKGNERTPPEGGRVTVEEGSYGSGKRR